LKINLIEKVIGSGLFTGYIPYASGTFGSLAAIIIYLIPGFENPTIMFIAISFFLVIGAQIGSKFEKNLW
jgi:phosphatidylglycerophosphatase A